MYFGEFSSKSLWHSLKFEAFLGLGNSKTQDFDTQNFKIEAS